ncbi:MAG: hypothetical protein ACREH6_05905 [Geminicoccaceae bacterium]
MFGLSLAKVLFTILVIVVIWRGFALLGRLAKTRDERLAARPSRPGGKSPRPSTVDLVRCPDCGAYFDPREGCHCSQG